MTTYILHGGEASRPTEDNRKFFRKMTDSVSDHSTILLVFYARIEEVWQDKFEQFRKIFYDADPGKSLSFICADPNLEIFKKQIAEADLVYINGGTTQLLLDKLKDIHNLSELFQEKIIAGSSAGACALSRYFQTGSPGKHVREGLGILPIKVFVHYSQDRLDLLTELEEVREELPIYKIPEEEYIFIQE